MSVIDEILEPTVITQEFVVRVSVQSNSHDSKVIRNILDGVAATLDTINYKCDGGKVEVTNVYPK